ncbi:hypothetical protein DVH92_18120 [Salmonella enterica]|nr:hypothetical protein [Salmonella enterica]
MWKIQIISVLYPARLQGCKAARLQGCKAARLQGCKAGSLKSTRFILSSLVLALFLTSHIAFADISSPVSPPVVGQDSTAFGEDAEASAKGSTAYGKNAHADGVESTAIGNDALVVKSRGTATGTRARAGGTESTATGYWSLAHGLKSTAIGSHVEVFGDYSVGLGAYSKSSHDYEVNIGVWSDETQTQTRTLSGLSDGVNDDEAVNMKQLKDADKNAKGYASDAQSAAEKTAKGYADTVKGEAIKEANLYTDNSASQAVSSANRYTNHRAVQAENNAVALSKAYTDNRFGELRKSLEHTEKRLNAGVAGVTALSSIPYAAGNNFSYGIGAGNYQNGNAVAAGVQLRVSQSTNVRLNISWDSAGNNATGVGIAGGW